MVYITNLKKMHNSIEFKIKNIKEKINSGFHKQAFEELNLMSFPHHDFVLQSRYFSIFKSIPLHTLNLKPIRLAVLSSSTVDHLLDILKYWLAKEGFSADIFSSKFDTIQQTVLDASNPLYDFKPDLIWIFTNYRDVPMNLPYGASEKVCSDHLSFQINKIVAVWNTIKKNHPCQIIHNNADIPDSRILGNYEANVLWSRTNLLRQFNLELSKVVSTGVTLFDLEHISSLFGKDQWHEPRYWYHSKHAFSLDASGTVAIQAAKLIGAAKGLSKKCIVIDLDNTLWGGVIADDGIDGIELGYGVNGEAFVDFQQYLKSLKERGIILTVCSKNDEDLAREPFLKHPDMQLQLEDITVLKTNWNNKADNIREIASILNLSLDSLVFIEDNPVERELVRTFLPEVCTIELSEDPTTFIKTIDRYALFETISISEDDLKRSDHYRENVLRKETQHTFKDLDEFLTSLNMESEVKNFDDFNLSRITQLINKSNQFHLTTTRYSVAQIKTSQEDPKKFHKYFKLKDRFGDNGLVSAVILEKINSILSIDTWVMSCRVLSRGMEEFVFSEIVRLARALDCNSLQGKYIPTKKNRLVSTLYESLGFTLSKRMDDGSTLWNLNLLKTNLKYKTTIRLKTSV